MTPNTMHGSRSGAPSASRTFHRCGDVFTMDLLRKPLNSSMLAFIAASNASISSASTRPAALGGQPRGDNVSGGAPVRVRYVKPLNGDAVNFCGRGPTHAAPPVKQRKPDARLGRVVGRGPRKGDGPRAPQCPLRVWLLCPVPAPAGCNRGVHRVTSARHPYIRTHALAERARVFILHESTHS